jgi:hypothetical protein
VRQLSEALQRCECGLIEIGRQHARNFDAGHAPSGGGVQRVLTELRTLAAERWHCVGGRRQGARWPMEATENSASRQQTQRRVGPPTNECTAERRHPI